MSAARDLDEIRAALEGREPGTLVDPYAPSSPVRPASVLIPVYEDRGESHILLVRRSDHLGKHAGQIAFPGGGRDPGEDELGCALREAEEEVGILRAGVEILGRLDRYGTITGYLVSPFVARLDWPCDLRPDPGEVAAVLQVPLARLVEPGTLRVAAGERGAVNFFDVGDEVIWGATARMLRQLLELKLGRPLIPSGPVPWDKVRW
ncbi:MAG TPA: CoA pyrophosphatase [Vulgatibacter sp.]